MSLRQEELPPPRDPSSPYSSYPHTMNQHNGSVTLNRGAIARQSFFRIRRDRSDILATLQAELATARQERADALKQVREQSKNLDKLGQDLSTEKETSQRSREEIERLRKQMGEMSTLKAKLERDIGKLREHIGRKAFDEILPPETPSPKASFT